MARGSRRSNEGRKGGFWGKFLAFILGMFMGIFLIVGAVVGVGYYAYTRPVGKTVKKVETFAPGLYATLFGTDKDTGILHERYATMQVGELLKDVTDRVSSLSGEGSLSTVTEISPKVNDYVAKLLDKTTEFGISIDQTELMGTSFKQLGGYLGGELKKTELGALLASFDALNDDLLIGLCYGQEGVDYDVIDGKITMRPDKTATTINSLMAEDGVTGTIKKISLQTVMSDFSDDLTRALVCGPSTRYEYTDGMTEPVMKQMVFTYEDRGEGFQLYDDMGNVMKYFDKDNGILTLKENDEDPSGEILYLQEQTTVGRNSSEVITYLAFTDSNYQNKSLYKKTSFGDLLNSPTDIVYGLHLADVLGIEFGDDSDKLLQSIAFDENGKPVAIEALLNPTNLIQNIALADALGLSPDDEGTHAILKSLAFDENGESRKLEAFMGDNATDLINDIALADALGISKDDENTHAILKSLIFDENGEARKLSSFMGDNATELINDISLADALDIKNDDSTPAVLKSLVFDENGESRKLSALMGENANDLINDITLADALGIDKDDENTHAILKSLAFDEEGNPRKLEAFMGENATNLINDIALADALGIKNDDSTPAVLKSLVFDENGESRKLSALMGDNATDLINGITLYDALGITDESNLHAVLKYLVFDENGEKRSIGELQGSGATDLINKLTLKDALQLETLDFDNLSSTSKILLSIACGEEGVDYEIITLPDGSKEINPKDGGRPFRTISDLTTEDILADISLADALNLTPDDPNMSAVLKALVFKEDNTSRTLSELTGTQATDLINGIALGDALGLKQGSHKILLSLAFPDGYTFDSDGNAIPVSGGKQNTLNDLMGDNSQTLINGIALGDALNITNGSHKILISLAFPDGYVENADGSLSAASGTQATTLGDLMGDGSQTLINKIKLADALGLKQGSHKILLSLAFPDGYTFDSDGNAIPVPGGKQNTLNDLMGDGSQDLINSIALGDALNITNGSHKILISLAFPDGYVENADGSLSAASGTQATTLGDLTGDGSQTLINKIKLADALGLKQGSHKILLSIAFPDGYKFDADGNAIPATEGGRQNTLNDLMGDGSANLINEITLADALGLTKDSHIILIDLAFPEGYEVGADGYLVAKEGTTATKLSDLTGDGSATLINNITIADALNVTPSSHRVLISLAYGAKDKDYKIVDGEIVPINPPRTIAQLTGPNSQEIIDAITLADTLGLTEDSHRVLLSLAFGTDGYTFDAEGNAMAKPGVEPATLKDLTGGGNMEFINKITVSDALGIDDNSHAVLKSLAKNEDGTYRTLGDLSGNGSVDLINNIALADIIQNIDQTDSLIMFMLYGREGIHYNMNGSEVQMQRKYIMVSGNTVYNEYGEPTSGTFLSNVYTDVKGVAYNAEHFKTENGKEYYYLSKDGEEVYFAESTLGDLAGSDNLISNLTKRITVREIMGDNIASDDKILVHVLDATIETLPTAINDLTIQQIFADDIYDENGNVTGTWKYLLFKDGVEQQYKITDFNDLVTNMTTNVTNASVKQLSDDQIITGIDTETLETTEIAKTFPDLSNPFGSPIIIYEGDKTYIAEFTIVEMFDYVTKVLNLIP